MDMDRTSNRSFQERPNVWKNIMILLKISSIQTENLRAFHATMSNININSLHMYMYAYYIL